MNETANPQTSVTSDPGAPVMLVVDEHAELLMHHAELAASATWATANTLALGIAGGQDVAEEVRRSLARQSKGLEQVLCRMEATASDRTAGEDFGAARMHALCAAERLQPGQHVDGDAAVRRGGAGDDEAEVMHTAGYWRVLLNAIGLARLRAVCGASLIEDNPPPVRGCSECDRRLRQQPKRRWNAVLALALLLLVGISVVLGVDAYREGRSVDLAVNVGSAVLCLTGLGRWIYLLRTGERR